MTLKVLYLALACSEAAPLDSTVAHMSICKTYSGEFGAVVILYKEKMKSSSSYAHRINKRGNSLGDRPHEIIFGQVNNQLKVNKQLNS